LIVLNRNGLVQLIETES